MAKRYFFLFLLISIHWIHPVWSQKNACVTEDKKLLKAIQPLKDELDLAKASILFKELAEKYPENAELSFIMAEKTLKQANKLAKDSKKTRRVKKLSNASISFIQLNL